VAGFAERDREWQANVPKSNDSDVHAVERTAATSAPPRPFG
jgi:hypothetical protein